jgi:hypothetical protein
MKRILVGAVTLIIVSVTWGSAQSLEDLNIQFHGYATQGLLYTTNNNILTTNSSSGSASWTEAVINISAQPMSKLRISVQARYELLGNLADGISMDYASADYKANDRLGVRFGKVKIPSNLFNEIQDIDPAYPWALLPQSVYNISNRDGILSQYGGIAYGTLGIEGSPKLGKLEYRGWGGETVLSGNDGYFLSQTEAGLSLPNGFSTPAGGAALHYRTPLPGLMFGASVIRAGTGSAKLVAGSAAGSEIVLPYTQPAYFAKYEKSRLMAAAEFDRLAGTVNTLFTGAPVEVTLFDLREMYAMASYKLTAKLTTGVYDSYYSSRDVAPGPARFQKDWAISGRYDFNQYIYAKAEEHFLDGTAINYDTDLNPGGLKPTTKMTVLKIGVSF